jgi:O-antigen ligase/Flp pilus assembly protein TadD
VKSKTLTVLFSALMFCVPLIYIPGIFDFTRHPRLLVIQLVLLLACLLLTFAYSPPRIPRDILLALASWTLWTLLTTLWATNPVEGLLQAQRVLVFSLVPIVLCCIPSVQAIKSIYAVACLTGLVISFIGICQFFGLGFAFIPTVGNPSATFGYRNFAASYVVVLMPAAIGFALSDETRKYLAWAVSAFSMALFLGYTRTRGAWLGLLVAVLLAIGIAIYLSRFRKLSWPIFRSHRWPTYAILAALLCVGVLLPDHMEQTGKFKFDERKSDAVTTLSTVLSPSDARGRLIVWRHTLAMVADHPLFGVGLGSWQFEYPKYDGGDWITDNTAPQRPHNDFLWILSETGLVGLGLFLFLLGTLARQTWLRLNRPSDQTTIWMVGIGVGLLAFLGHSFFSFPQERPGPSLIFWTGVGSIARLAFVPRHDPISLRPVFALAVPLLACGMFLSYRNIQFDKSYLAAQVAWRAEDWQRLLAASTEGLGWGPLNYRLYLLQGAAYQQLGQVDRAVASYEQAQAYHPNEGHAALGKAYLALGNYDAALGHLRSEFTLYPRAALVKADLVGALVQAGNHLQLQQSYALAARVYEEAFSLEGSDPRLLNNLGSVYLALGKPAEAESAFLRVLALQPGYSRVYHNLGDLYAGQRDSSRAIDAYQKFIETWQGDAQMIDIATRKRNLLSPTTGR